TILYFDHTASMSGGEIALLHLLQALDRARYVPLVVLGIDGPLAQRLQAMGIETLVLPLDPQVAQTRKDSLKGGGLLRLGSLGRSLRYALRLARLMRSRQVDLVHTNSLKADILGGIAARLAGVPVIWHVRDRIADDYLPALAARGFRLLCRLLPHYIIANSHATLQTLSTPPHGGAAVIHSGVVRSSLRVVHDGVPDPVLSASSEVGGRSPVIGLVGRISPWKGQHIFISAASAVVKRYPTARFEIIGSALFGEEAYEREVRSQVQGLGLEGCVEFTGFCEDVQSRMQGLDILVHASTTGEPFGQVVVEGMVLGKPVVATNGGGVPEIVLDGETGVLVPMGDAVSMAEAICGLLADPARAQAMGLAARNRALDHFTVDLAAQKVQQVYDLFCKPGSRGKPDSAIGV
ncbi:MAG TPA: glycosyltransferase, partial [Chthonomonadaceae bacterium]|nr:glycosyltransferase [Chthonomonadaceae bacterium]